MTTVAPPSSPAVGRCVEPAARGGRPRRTLPPWRTLAPTLFVALNAIVFVVVRPDVNDLWAARARASAVQHGVGLTYWFGWFGGGSTPGNYSIVTPYLCAWLGTEIVGGVAAVVLAALATAAVRGTRGATAAALVAAVATLANLWSGRVPFLLGAAFAVAALLAVRARRRAPAALLTLLAILGSPVAGAFLVLGLTGWYVADRRCPERDAIRWSVATVVLGLGLDALVFGAGGPEPLSWARFAILVVGTALLLFAGPPPGLRATIWLSLAAVLVIAVVPNGMGSNIARFAWFCLPVAVVALGRARLALRLAVVLPLLGAGVVATIGDLADASRPSSSVAFYGPLLRHLADRPSLADHRVEVVDHGGHAGYDALLGHVSLARGWETQADLALNGVLQRAPLRAVAYRRWLDANAVGWVAVPRATGLRARDYPEYALVAHHRPDYLRVVWQDADWQLLRVTHARSIVGEPATLLRHSQSAMTIDVPCACTVEIRVRWSRFLRAVRVQPTAGPAGVTTPVAVTQPPLTATITDDGAGWTRLTTTRAGHYWLSGSLAGLLH